MSNSTEQITKDNLRLKIKEFLFLKKQLQESIKVLKYEPNECPIDYFNGPELLITLGLPITKSCPLCGNSL